jgi:hypothetical protein
MAVERAQHGARLGGEQFQQDRLAEHCYLRFRKRLRSTARS